ncbi:MAG: tetratricopeptide repeat protein [Acidobacteriota bacterium]|nr:tetratricopeptide repeat protein [Acidobacteriota bacterium]
MKRFFLFVSLLAILVGLSAIPALAQAGSVKGSAKDENGKAIADATVELDNVETGKKVTTKTNGKGEYTAMGLPPGAYNAILIDKDGKRIDAFGKVPVAASQETPVNFDLKKDKAGGPSAEEVKKYEAAKAANEKIKGLNAILAQARDLDKAGNYDQSIALLQPAAEQNPAQDLLWGYLGDAYRGAKKYPEAIDAYGKALQLKPKNGGYMSGLADAYAKAGQTDKAVQEYNAAAEAEPANAGTYYFNEGAVFTNTGKVDEALAAFDKVIAADPTRADAYYWKGVNLVGKATTGKDGKFVAPPGTAEAFQKYLELKPDGPNAEAAKQMLASIGASVETSYGKGKSTSKTPPKKQ